MADCSKPSFSVVDGGAQSKAAVPATPQMSVSQFITDLQRMACRATVDFARTDIKRLIEDAQMLQVESACIQRVLENKTPVDVTSELDCEAYGLYVDLVSNIHAAIAMAAYDPKNAPVINELFSDALRQLVAVRNMTVCNQSVNE